jgi:hypothetical protein
MDVGESVIAGELFTTRKASLLVAAMSAVLRFSLFDFRNGLGGLLDDKSFGAETTILDDMDGDDTTLKGSAAFTSVVG